MLPGIGRDPDCDAQPVLGPSEHDLDAITPSVAAHVVFHDRVARLPTRDGVLPSNAYRSRSALCPRSTSSHSAFGRSPGSAADGVVADLPGRHVRTSSVGLPHQLRRADLCSGHRSPDRSVDRAPHFFTRAASRALCIQRGRIDHDRVRIDPWRPGRP